MTTTGPGDLVAVSDDELAAEAVAADPDPSLDGAIPFAQMVGMEGAAALPDWYMPAPTAGTRLPAWRRGVVYTFVAALLTIEAFGLCTTFGPNF